jgi:hypothetical protein
MNHEYGIRSPDRLTFDEAFLYCLTHNFNGHKDWYMPTFTMWVFDDVITGWHSSAKLQRDISYDISRVIPVRDIDD